MPPSGTSFSGNSRREAARIFGLSRETVLKMCRFSLPPGYTRTKPVVALHLTRFCLTLCDEVAACVPVGARDQLGRTLRA